MSHLYRLRGHQPYQVENTREWGQWFETSKEERIVAQDHPVPGVMVSTVFLSIDHNFAKSGPAVLFETMVFGGNLDQEQARYCTWEEAEAGHKAMVQRVIEPMPQTAQDDPELTDWLLGIHNGKPVPAGDFLKSLAEAALRADPENYPLMRPMLLELRAKYPKYSDPG